MCSSDQLRKLVAKVRPVGRMSLEPCKQHNCFENKSSKSAYLMISEESCDTEDWSNDAEYSALPSQE